MILDLFQELQVSRRWSARWKALAKFRGWPASKHERRRQLFHRLVKALENEYQTDEVREIIEAERNL